MSIKQVVNSMPMLRVTNPSFRGGYLNIKVSWSVAENSGGQIYDSGFITVTDQDGEFVDRYEGTTEVEECVHHAHIGASDVAEKLAFAIVENV